MAKQAKEGGLFTEDHRELIKGMMNELAEVARQDYQQTRASDLQFAKSVGVDPNLLLGSNIDLDFTPIPTRGGTIIRKVE